MPWRPINDYLLVELDEDEWLIPKPERIEIPSEYIGAYRKRSTIGKVVAMGSKCRMILMKGTKVRFPRTTNRQGVDGMRFVKEEELEAIIDD